LLVDHCELPTIATTDNGTMKLTDTPMGLLVEANINNGKVIEQIEAGKIIGLSVGALPREKHEYAGVTVHRCAALEEVSLCTKAPGNPLTALVIVNRPISTATQQALSASATPLEQRRAGVIRELLNVRQRLLAL
jgi:phage head maturation protease